MIKSGLALIGLFVVLFFGLGAFFNWYDFSWDRNENGNVSIKIEVNSKKITKDLEKGKEKTSEFIGGLKKDSTEPKPEEFVGPPLPKDFQRFENTGFEFDPNRIPTPNWPR